MKVSFITASYNYAHYITQTIESIQSQTIQDWELIVVDDGSKDNSVEVIKSYCQKDSRIKLFQHEFGINKGLIATIKLGIEKASSDWIAFVESDDFITPDYLEKKLEILKTKKDVGLIFNDVELIGDETYIRKFRTSFFDNYTKKCSKYKQVNSIVELSPIVLNLSTNPIPTFSCVMVKKNIMQELDFQSPSDKFIDWLLWSQIIAKNIKIFYLSESLTKWRISGNSYSKTGEEESVIELLRNKIMSFFKYENKKPLLKILRKLLLDIRISKRSKFYSITIFGINIANKNNDFPAFLKICIKSNKKFNKKEHLKYLNWLEDLKTNKSCFVPLTQTPYQRKKTDVKLFAYYLPQFHAILENDIAHGKGFTEWTNVASAIPFFPGHYQPKIPYDVGFYNLLQPGIMERQAELAKTYGIYGFCFYYYWFSGKKVLEKPLEYFLKSDIDIKFHFCWANENWSKLWDGGDKEIILKQQINDNDAEKFFEDILPFIKDKRYEYIDNKPLLMIYSPSKFEKTKIKKFLMDLNVLAQKHGFDGFYFMASNAFGFDTPKEYGFNGIIEFPPHATSLTVEKNSLAIKNANFITANATSYIKDKKYINKVDYELFKCCFPAWDNTPRKAFSNGMVINMTSEDFELWLTGILEWTVTNNPPLKQYAYINAWNEWAEGAILEPTTRYGYQNLDIVKRCLEKFQKTEYK